VRRTLYWKRLLIVVAAFLVLTGGVLAVHHFQMRSHAGALKDRATRAAALAQSDPSRRGEALGLFKDYMRFRPDDEAAYREYADLLFAEVKDDPLSLERLAPELEGFLRAFPNHAEDRQKLIELYIATAQTAKLLVARQHLEMLFSAPGGDDKTNTDLLELAATCEQGLGNLSGAIGHIEAAIATGKAPVRAYQRAMELHAADRSDPKRNTYIDDHLRTLRSGRFATDLKARVAAARFEMVLGNWGPARADMKEAFEKLGGASDPDALLAQAELELSSVKTLEQAGEQYAKAETHLRSASAIDKKNVPVGILLAEVLARQGKLDDGVQILKQTAEALGAVNDQYLMVVDRLLDLGERELSATLIEKMAKDPTRRVIVSYCKGRLAVLKQDWSTALHLLEESAPNLIRLPEYHKKAMVGLAACYSAMQNPDQQLDYCRKALRDDGRFPIAMIGEAEALVRMGEYAEAVKRYRAIVNAMQLVAYRNELVKLELLDVLVQPNAAEVRNWARFEESLGAPAGRTAEIHIYQAEALLARNLPAEAVKLLSEWLAAHPMDPKAPAVWVALARIKDGGKLESAASVLDEAEKKVGDAVDIRLARVGLLAARIRPPAPDDFDSLAAGFEKFPTPDRYRLQYGIGQTAGRVADRGGEGDTGKRMRETSIKHLRAAADVMPHDLASRAALLDQGIAAGRKDVVEQVLKEMASIEGENGPVGTLGRIAVRLPEVRALADPTQRAAGVADLRALARRVRDSRPGWSRVYVALAQLDEIEGLNDAALAHYREAIKKGERQEFVIRRAVNLYRTKRQDEAALGMLRELSTEMRLPDDLERYRSIHTLLANELPQNARETIDRIAPSDSTDYRIQLLRGALLGTIRDDDGALKAFLRAVEVPGGEKVPGEGPIPAGEEVPETWASLVAQLVKTNKIEDAKRAVAQAQKKLTSKPARGPEARAELEDALAGLYELVGDRKTALEYYQTANRSAPLELNPIRQLIFFFQRAGQSEKALELLNDAKDSPAPEIARWARRHLALTLIARPDAYNQRAAALALVERNLAASATDPEDLKAQALIRTVDPVTREEGVRTLRQFGDRGDLTPDEYFVLGHLAFDQGKYAEAAQYFRLGARPRPGVTAEHMAALVRVYVALGVLDEAEKALERLKTHYPNTWDAVREEARLLHRKSKDKAALAELEDSKKLLEQARAVIVKYPGWDAAANLASKSGPLFEEVGLLTDAEAAYKKYLAESDQPNAHVPLALFYIMRKQPEKAIALARERESKVPVVVTAQLLTGAVRMKRPAKAVEEEIEKWLDDKIRAAAGNPEAEAPLIGARAQLLDAQRKYDEAIAEYERCVATFKRAPNPKGTNDFAVNNLSMLLALHAPKRAGEAAQMMTDLIAIRGPVPAYLDTRAVAYIQSSRPEDAVKDLQMALIQHERAAYRYHLAWALDLDPSKTRAIFPIDELKAAKRIGLADDDLHPIEYERYIELLKKYRLPLDEK
jgi:lipopolysaccharide biosynthesis regulator YciM